MDQTIPKIGYIPGNVPWLVQAALKEQGMVPLNTAEKGKAHVDRELITGDGASASHRIGVVAALLLVAAWAKRD